MWAGVTKKNIERLQKVQNFAVRIVTGARKFGHITPYLKDLNWLPVAMQLEVRGIIMTYTSGNHRLESAGLNALEELLRCWEWTEKIVIRACVF